MLLNKYVCTAINVHSLGRTQTDSIFKERLRKVMMPSIITSYVTCCINIVSVRFATYFCLCFAGR
jgi:hypothetical protein